jgi:hypothetical protein
VKAVVASLRRVPLWMIHVSEEDVNDGAQRALRRHRAYRIPPVLLVRSATHYWPLDGNNRVTHARWSGKRDIQAYVITRKEYRRLRDRLDPWWHGDLDDDIWVSKTKTYSDLRIRG